MTEQLDKVLEIGGAQGRPPPSSKPTEKRNLRKLLVRFCALYCVLWVLTVLIGGAQVKAKNVSNDGIPLERQSYMGWNWGIRIRSPMPFIVGISMSGSNPRDGQIWWNKKYYAWFFGATIEIADQVAYWDDWCMWLWKL